LRDLKGLLVGVSGHGGEEVYSSLLRDHPPPGITHSATFAFHESCAMARCRPLAEIALNQLVHPWLRFDLGFRVLDVAPAVDLVHIHSHPTILRKLAGRPVVFSAGSSHYHWVKHYEGWPDAKIAQRHARARRIYRRFGVLDALLNHATITLSYTFSHYARQVYLERGVPDWKIRVLYPGFDIPPPAATRRTGVTFLFMGRDPRRKGGDLVLDAFRELRRERRDVSLLFVSDELPAAGEDGVEGLPLVPAAEVPSLYRRADVFLSPTRAEGFGFANVEAQGFGLPVISTRLGAIPEVVEEGRSGFLIEPGDRSALLAAMRRLAAEGTLREDMARRGRERFEERFSLAGFQRGLAGIYEEAIQRART
jgi:glycosyltransferase involved in cell wall biosynthesis